MINKKDFIDKDTNLYNLRSINGAVPSRQSLVKEEELGPSTQVAGMGRALKGVIGAITPDRFKTARSVREIREEKMKSAGIPELTGDDITNVLSNEAPEGPFTGTQQGDLSGMTPERNVNLDNINTPDDIKSVIDDMSQFQGGNIEARRGAISHAETIRMAQAQSDAVELITGWKPATTWNAEQITSARQLMVNVAQNIQVDAKRLMSDSENTTAEDWANFAKKQKTFAAIQNTVSGATAEAGRTLSALNIPIEGDQKLAAVSQILDQAGGEDLLKKKAELIAELANLNPDMLARRISDIQGRTKMDALAEVWINGRLSNPVTHMVNITSNSFTQAYESYMVKPTAAVIGAIRKATGGKDESISWDEVGAETYGMMSSFGEAIDLFGKHLAKTDNINMFVSVPKHEMSNWNAFSSGTILPDVMQGTHFAKAIDMLGDYYVRLPGRFLESEDLFFKTIAYRKDLNSQSVRMAKQERLTGEAYSARVNDLINNPTREMDRSASSRSEYETFTNDPAEFGSLFGDMAKSFSYLTARHSSLKFVLPFIRTPANIVRYATENSALAPVTKKWRDDYKAGGIKRDTALARWSLGSIALASITQMYDTGSISGGGPTDQGSQKAMRMMGWQPHSIRVGDRYYAFNRMDPMGFSMSMVAGAMDRVKYARSEEEATGMMLDLTMSLGQSFMDKTFMSGFAELMKLASYGSEDKGKAGVKFASNITASFVPAWLTLAASASDTDAQGRAIVRDPSRFSKSYDGIWANFEKTWDSRTPWAKTDLPAQRNWKGEVVTHSGGGWADEMFFIKRSDAKTDPSTRALLENWVAPSVPPSIQSFPLSPELAAQYGMIDVDIDILDLDENQGAVFEEFQAYIGRSRASIVREFVVSKKYQSIPPEQRGNGSIAASVLESLLEMGMQQGKLQFFSDYNKLAKERGWMEFTSDKVVQLIERKLGEQGKEFEMPQGPSGTPEF